MNTLNYINGCVCLGSVTCRVYFVFVYLWYNRLTNAENSYKCLQKVCFLTNVRGVNSKPLFWLRQVTCLRKPYGNRPVQNYTFN